MAFKTFMTWEPGRRRWKKMHKGKVYLISCEALGVPDTKEASYKAANEWWLAQLNQRPFDNDAFRKEHPFHPDESRITILSRRRELALKDGDSEEAAKITGQIEAVQVGEAGLSEATLLNMRAFEAIGGKLPENLPAEFAEEWFGPNKVFRERTNRAEKVPVDRTAGGQFKRYLASKMAESRAKNLSVSEVDLIRLNVGKFVEFLGERTPIEAIEKRWSDWWLDVIGLELAIETRKKRYRYARAWVWWMVEEGLIPVFPGLRSRRRFKGGVKAVPTMTVDEVRTLIEAAPGQLKLHLLLMANTGMTQQDISDLRQNEVDWKAGRIRRKRSKTDDHENVPTVDYKLWPMTFRLLQEHRQPGGERALLTVSGKPWVRDFFKPDGKRSKVDSIKSNYVHVQKRLKIEKPMKLLRKTSATLIDQNFSTLFLGHSPRTMKDRHYVAPDEAGFDAAVLKLGKVYGFS